MSREASATKRTCPRAAIASYTVQFQKRPRHRTQGHQEPTAGRIPRVTRLLALAHKINRMIRSGEIGDWAEAARLVGVTRARMTQIANLLLLAPGIQEAILNLPPIFRGHDPITEHDFRVVAAHEDWRTQTMVWTPLVERPRTPPAA